MNYQNSEEIKRYQTQILYLIIIIFAILISISVLKIFIDIAKGYTTYKKEEINILNRSKIAAIIVLFATIYFFNDALNTYKKNQNQTNLRFVIATMLVLIATILRLINLFTSNSDLSNIDKLSIVLIDKFTKNGDKAIKI